MTQDREVDLTAGMCVDDVASLGRLVRQVRNRQGMTQADILGLASTGNRFIVELENGKPTVRLDKVLAVLDVLGLELQVRKKGRR
ncbi:MAG TPA: helix-turn-helix transcriptional regulator [Gallionella sp.]|nr:helix-turn-helix transcriptional regulator [Gallionella sp.]